MVEEIFVVRVEMLDISTEEGPPAVLSNSYRSGEESGEDGLAVLPRHTKVLVTGNNRTKSVLVGLHGVVTKAVGLGGWHWLVLLSFCNCRPLLLFSENSIFFLLH